MKFNSIDIFCEIIDNYGDIGVAYRLARELKFYYTNKKIRLLVSGDKEFNLIKSNEENLEVIKFCDISEDIEVADLLFECFGCNIPEIYMEKAYFNSQVLINLEYFSSENWIEDFHLQESLLGKGKLKKYFFMPGISKKSGGIIIDSEFIQRKNKVLLNREYYLKKYGIDKNYDLIGSIFSYKKDFNKFILELEKINKNILLLIFDEKVQKNFIKYFDKIDKYDRIKIMKLPFHPYDEYEEILSLCDFNFVRGEDSFARALLLGKPFLWHIYPQNNNIHIKKLESFLDKYWPDNIKLKETFLNYNLNNDDYKYFFQNFNIIKNYNNKFSNYLLKNCNLINKLNSFIENLGGNK